MDKLAAQAIESQAAQIKTGISMVGICIMNEDFAEAAKFAASLSAMAHGTSYHGMVEKYIASVNFIFEK